ncbi:hypothetical protein [Bartonella senegalensis]|uniref:hypothetical protein n=1 Tax=Bartonella senegalensis TaxID=1468418 RepID=UPI000553ABE5|nr:hypothetical protein [Bartonella senegalensis]
MNRIVEITQRLIAQAGEREKSTASQSEAVLIVWQALYPHGLKTNHNRQNLTCPAANGQSAQDTAENIKHNLQTKTKNRSSLTERTSCSTHQPSTDNTPSINRTPETNHNRQNLTCPAANAQSAQDAAENIKHNLQTKTKNRSSLTERTSCSTHQPPTNKAPASTEHPPSPTNHEHTSTHHRPPSIDQAPPLTERSLALTILANLSEGQARWQEKKFRNTWHAKNSKEALKVDWQAIWRNGFQSEIERIKDHKERFAIFSSHASLTPAF